MEKKINTFIIKLIIVIIIIIIAFFIMYLIFSNNKNSDIKLSIENLQKNNNSSIDIEYLENKTENLVANSVIINTLNTAIKENTEIDDWRLVLVNYENDIPENYTVDLTNIDEYRAVDSRIFDELIQMIKDMKKLGLSGIWIQSAYRSIDHQSELYLDKVNEYIAQGKTLEESEKLTGQVINKPKASEHNLGLAIDFNYVDYDFEKTKEYAWLLQNARNYGFILRYPKEKEDITKVNFEPWHWRYVGVEHALKITELGMCLEEYIEYLKNVI